MGFAPNPIQSYHNVGYETDIMGSDPHRLIILLFEGALHALDKAENALNKSDFQEKTNALTKAIEIILDGLGASLNLEEGGDLAKNLKALYDYMASRLTHANFQNDVTAINEVRGLLNELCDTWREIAPEPASIR